MAMLAAPSTVGGAMSTRGGGGRALRKLVGDLEGIDFQLAEVPEDGLGEALASSLYTKGFCALGAALDGAALPRALDDVARLRAAGRFRRPPEQIAVGLLGLEGSAEIADFEPGGLGTSSSSSALPPSASRAGAEAAPGLDEVVESLLQMGLVLSDWSEDLGMEMSHHTNAVVHEAGLPVEEPPELTEKDVDEWLGTFVRHKLMAIAFLGPSEGVLRLQVYADEESEQHEIRTRPGMVVLLRPDLMSHSHSALGKAVAISSFFVDAHGYQKRHATGGWIVCPVAAELDAWAMRRIKELKMEVEDDEDWDPEIPREWQRAMNLYFFKGAAAAVCGLAGRFPRCWEAESWFRTLSVGPDVVTAVPKMRWDHEFCYDPAPESWRGGKTFTKHAGFMEGVDLFDNKLFGISNTESKGMDPGQRHLLELGYEAFTRMGLTKKHLMNAAGSVYAGNQAFEFSFVEVPRECQGCGPTGLSGCIAANRISFSLGLKGPSMGVDTDTCSSMSALYLAAESLQQKGRGKAADFGVGLGCAMMYTPLWWHNHNAMGWMGARGRCFSFDAVGDGYVRAEAVIGAAMKPYVNVVDGKSAADADDDVQRHGCIAGCALNTNGSGARLSAPNGRAEQEVIAETVRNAGISALDLDVVEAHSFGTLLGDAIEVSSLTRAHRDFFGGEAESDGGCPLIVSSVKTNGGHTMESSGITSLVKVLLGAQFGFVAHSVHLREVNPHMDVDGVPVLFPSDPVDLWRESNFSGVLSKGWGGTNGYCITWGKVDRTKVNIAPGCLDRQKLLSFWPGGGGDLEPELRPEGGYWIAGSWTEWEAPEPMEEESVGVFGYTVTIGVNGWEHFQIWLDADPTRVLHPGFAAAPASAPVLGPDEERLSAGASWLLRPSSAPRRGRAEGAAAAAALADAGGPSEAGSAAAAALAGGSPPSSSSYSSALARFGAGGKEGGDGGGGCGPGAGIGERYRVRLHVAGKWRRVEWERLEQVFPIEQLPLGRYYLIADWNGWEFEEMNPDPSAHGCFFAEVVLQQSRGNFRILRNRDFAQAFHPSRAACPEPEDLVGPDAGDYGLDWCISGAPGDCFRISFERRLPASSAASEEEEEELRRVSWRRIEPPPPPPLDGGGPG